LEVIISSCVGYLHHVGRQGDDLEGVAHQYDEGFPKGGLLSPRAAEALLLLVPVAELPDVVVAAVVGLLALGLVVLLVVAERDGAQLGAPAALPPGYREQGGASPARRDLGLEVVEGLRARDGAARGTRRRLNGSGLSRLASVPRLVSCTADSPSSPSLSLPDLNPPSPFRQPPVLAWLPLARAP
jgi:hypothetical protein